MTWLNIVLLSAGSLFVGFLFGVVVARPRRWDVHDREGSVPPHEMAPWTRLTSSNT